jgi:predicted nucleic acid-binding protein
VHLQSWRSFAGDAFDPYHDEPINTADHEYAARVYNECRNQGVEPGTVEILICAVAVRRGWEVLSSDGGMNRISRISVSHFRCDSLFRVIIILTM